MTRLDDELQNEGDLRERFAQLREHDQRRPPLFGAVLARSGRQHSAPIGALRVTLAAAGIRVAALLLHTPNRPSAEQAVRYPQANWRAPTDFLLDVPGDDMLRTTPDFGWSPQWPVTLLDPRRSHQ